MSTSESLAGVFLQNAQLVITATGAVTSVGQSAAAACAAIRANIARPRRVGHFQVLDSETQDTVSLTGHPIHGLTEGFAGIGRWMRLARGCIRDLLETAGLPGAADHAFWSRTGVVAVTPSPDDDLFDLEGNDGLEGIREDFLHPLCEELRLPIPQRFRKIVAKGAAGTASAIANVLSGLSSIGLERLLVVAADSQLDPMALQLLSDEERLKTDDFPVGLMPGEAGACLLLESPSSARRRGVRAQAVISGAFTGKEPHHLFSGEPNLGTGLAECLQEVLRHTQRSERFDGDIYIDLNGETWRAQEWGAARVRLGSVLGEPNIHLPCTSVGDVGSASGALGVCLAVHALSRGTARTGHVLVVSSSHWGDIGCISLHPSAV